MQLVNKIVGSFVLFIWFMGLILAVSILWNGDTDKSTMAIMIVSFETIFAYPLYKVFAE